MNNICLICQFSCWKTGNSVFLQKAFWICASGGRWIWPQCTFCWNWHWGRPRGCWSSWNHGNTMRTVLQGQGFAEVSLIWNALLSHRTYIVQKMSCLIKVCKFHPISSPILWPKLNNRVLACPRKLDFGKASRISWQPVYSQWLAHCLFLVLNVAFVP